MKRRDFLSLTGASLAASAIPLPMKAASASTAIAPSVQGWAQYIHALHGYCPATSLTALTKVTPMEAARALNSLAIPVSPISKPTVNLRKLAETVLEPEEEEMPDDEQT